MTSSEPCNSFDECFAQVVDAAYGMARHLAHDPDRADDLLQEVAIKAFRAFATFEPGSNFKAWFFRILVTTSINEQRKQSAGLVVNSHETGEEALDDTALRAAASNDPAELAVQRLDAQTVEAAFKALPEAFRQVALLYFFDQWSYEEIAEILSLPLGTVRSRLHRSRKLLQHALHDIAEERGIVRSGQGVDARELLEP